MRGFRPWPVTLPVLKTRVVTHKQIQYEGFYVEAAMRHPWDMFADGVIVAEESATFNWAVAERIMSLRRNHPELKEHPIGTTFVAKPVAPK